MAKIKRSLKEVKGQLKVVLEVQRYKMIPVDPETHEKFVAICKSHGRKQGAQVKTWVDREFEKLPKVEEEAAPVREM